MRRSPRLLVGALLPISFVLALVVALGLPGTAGADEYTVQEGDTLSEIGERLGVSLGVLAGANGIADVNHILPGQQLRLPAPGGGAAADATGADPGPGYHLVAPGESLESIAARYGVAPDDLARANGLTDRNQVWAGSRLRIATTAPANPTTPTHVQVGAGDTLSGIAERHGVRLATLVRTNDIDDPNDVAVGTWLTLPSGDLACPVDGSVRFVNDYGMAKPGGRFHEGVDLYAAAGTPVVASVDGWVENVQGTRGGLQFWLYANNGDVYVGTHLSGFGESGQVGAGTVIGYVGTSGNAVGSTPHLHFEWLPGGGDSANPYPMLAESC